MARPITDDISNVLPQDADMHVSDKQNILLLACRRWCI